jgi:lipid A 3-O-deacylase
LHQRHLITLSLVLALQVPLQAQEETYQRAFSVAFENDMFNKMDWYYTNGLQFLLYHNNLRKSPFDRALIPFKARAGDLAWHGLALRQELYTPHDLEDDTIRAGDHPYAATLVLSQERVVNRPENRIRFSSSLKVGVLGPAALGFNAQDIIHRITPSHPPKGWDYQVRNDVILNYDFVVEKEFYRDDVTILGVKSLARLGTLHTDFAGGIWFRMELGQEYFQRLGPNPRHSFNLYYQMETTGRFVIYDATLQGGLFNKTSPYVIASGSVKRLVGDIQASFVFEIHGHQLSFYQHLITSRFSGAGWHGWLGISYAYWW